MRASDFSRLERLVRDCVFVGNTAPGGSEAFCNQAAPRFENTLFAFNLVGEALECFNPPFDPVLVCCDLYGNGGGDWVGCIADQAGSDGNFSADPLFCDAKGGDFTLSSQSPCLPGNHPDGGDCGLIGALGKGCGPVSVEEESWAGIKSRYNEP